MTTIPLELGDIVSVTVDGLKLFVLATGLKHGEARAIPEGQNLATAVMILPSGGPNDVGTLMVCGPTKIAQPNQTIDRSRFNGPELCVDVNRVEEHFPKR